MPENLDFQQITKVLKPLIYRGFRTQFMAESKGFEPSERLWRSHDFQSCSFDQLGQLSVFVKCSYIILKLFQKIKS